MLFSACCLLLPVALANALDLGTFTPDRIKNVSSIVAGSLISNYTKLDKNEGVGLFGDDVYWWEAGAVWGSLIDYWSYTGDDAFNGQVTQALLAQIGPNHDYMVPNQTKTEGNDDQGVYRGLPFRM